MRATMGKLPERMKGWAGLLLLALVLAQVVLTAAWCVYTYAVRTPAVQQLATTHADMVGHWRGGAMSLDIEADGHITVQKGAHYGGKIWRFEGGTFGLWVYPCVPVHFHVDVPPQKHAGGEEWLVVDGYHLRRERP